jgi:hypothetical protein
MSRDSASLAQPIEGRKLSKGFVYILTNPSMPGVVKIGKTTGQPETRASQLYTSGVPTPFEVHYSVFCPDCHELEQIVHAQLSDLRVSNSREFFAIEAHEAARRLDVCHEEVVSDWLNDFMPDHAIVHYDLFVDVPTVMSLAEELAEPAPVIADALGVITADELAPLVKRVYAEHERRRVMREAQK